MRAGAIEEKTDLEGLREAEGLTSVEMIIFIQKHVAKFFTKGKH